VSGRAFRLASVLRVRHVQEEIARAELLRGNRVVQQAAVDRERSALHYRTLPVSTGSVPAPVFMREQALAGMAAATLMAADDHLVEARTHAEAAQRSWSEAAQRVEALERLAARRHEEVLAAEARTESASVDDLVTARWIAAESVATSEREAT